MADFRSLVCDDEARRERVREHETLNGIDYIEVVTQPEPDNQRVLNVFFIPKKTAAGSAGLDAMLAALDGAITQVSIVGGVRVQDVRVTSVQRVGDHLEVRVDEPGDFSTYTLQIDHVWVPADEAASPPPPKLDPAYTQCDFSFKAGCPSHFDCRPHLFCPAEPRVEPPIDTMAKDYASFRQALLDLAPTLVPEWTERHEADLGIALIELLAYAGDQLSYAQDAVANEAYLETARQRISVRRHAHLIDYRMHDGASARAFVHFQLTDGTSGVLSAGTPVLTRIGVPVRSQAPPHGPEFPAEAADEALRAAHVVFETFEQATLNAALNGVAIYTWGNRECCLPRGTTTLDLVGDLTAHLAPGDFLLFEEVKGAETGLEADADPDHRQIVRLTEVVATKDPLPAVHQPLTRVSWDRADALTFPLCLSAKIGPVTYVDGVSVARGNLVLADHGQTVTELHPGSPDNPTAVGIETGRRAYRFRLREGPLSFRVPRPEDNGALVPARALWGTDAAQAQPQVRMTSVRPTGEWTPVTPHLLDSEPFDRHFVVETDNDGRGVVRFGDGEYGMAPPDGACFTVTYRVGVGPAGNVGREALAHVVHPPAAVDWPSIACVRNPLPAWGGTAAQPLEQVKRWAPAAFHAEQFRAVTEADYVRVTEKHPEVAKALAAFRWTGSWYTIFVTVDPLGRADLPPALEGRLRAWITRFMQAGYDLEIDPPIYVPLRVELDVCVSPAHFRADVETAVLAALSNRILPDGRRGFFHPDRFTFGQPLYLSQLVAAVEKVEGVDSLVARRFVRTTDDDPDPSRPLTRVNVDRGYVAADRLEILRLDNDRNFPENGVLRLNMLGGK